MCSLLWSRWRQSTTVHLRCCQFAIKDCIKTLYRYPFYYACLWSSYVLFFAFIPYVNILQSNEVSVPPEHSMQVILTKMQVERFWILKAQIYRSNLLTRYFNLPLQFVVNIAIESPDHTLWPKPQFSIRGFFNATWSKRTAMWASCLAEEGCICLCTCSPCSGDLLICLD